MLSASNSAAPTQTVRTCVAQQAFATATAARCAVLVDATSLRSAVASVLNTAVDRGASGMAARNLRRLADSASPTAVVASVTSRAATRTLTRTDSVGRTVVASAVTSTDAPSGPSDPVSAAHTRRWATVATASACHRYPQCRSLPRPCRCSRQSCHHRSCHHIACSHCCHEPSPASLR